MADVKYVIRLWRMMTGQGLDPINIKIKYFVKRSAPILFLSSKKFVNNNSAINSKNSGADCSANHKKSPLL